MSTKEIDVNEFSRLQDLCTCTPIRSGDTYSTSESEHEEGCEYIRAIRHLRSEATRAEGFTRA